MTEDNRMTHDPELERILARASQPTAPTRGAAEIMAAIGRRHGSSTVVPFPAARVRVPWTALGALAASLAFGIYLGASGLADPFFDSDDLAGLEDPTSILSVDDDSEGEVS